MAGIGVGGASRTPLSTTALRAETNADMNRGRIRGWVFLGAALVAFLAVLDWPDLVGVLVFGALAASLVALGVVISRVLPDRESQVSSSRSRDG